VSDALFYVLAGCVALLALMIFRPIREFVLKLAGASSVWGLLWSLISIVFISHVTVLKNFLPRSFVYPTLDDRKTTNAED